MKRIILVVIILLSFSIITPITVNAQSTYSVENEYDYDGFIRAVYSDGEHIYSAGSGTVYKTDIDTSNNVETDDNISGTVIGIEDYQDYIYVVTSGSDNLYKYSKSDLTLINSWDIDNGGGDIESSSIHNNIMALGMESRITVFNTETNAEINDFDPKNTGLTYAYDSIDNTENNVYFSSRLGQDITSAKVDIDTGNVQTAYNTTSIAEFGTGEMTLYDSGNVYIAYTESNTIYKYDEDNSEPVNNFTVHSDIIRDGQRSNNYGFTLSDSELVKWSKDGFSIENEISVGDTGDSSYLAFDIFDDGVVLSAYDGSDSKVYLIEDDITVNPTPIPPESPELRLNTPTFMNHNEAEEYSVSWKDGYGVWHDVTENATVESSNINVTTVDNSSFTLNSTDNVSINEEITITAEYENLNTSKNLTVANISIGNLDILPPAESFNAVINDTPTQVIFSSTFIALFITKYLIAIGRQNSAWIGLGSSFFVILLAGFQEWIGTGIVFSAFFFVVLASIIIGNVRNDSVNVMQNSGGLQ